MMRSLGALMLILAGGTAPLAAQTPAPATVAVPAGPFVEGSSDAQREYAYQLDEAAYGNSRTREAEWYEHEAPPESAITGAFAIMTNLVSNADYARFVEATGHPAPNVERDTWAGYGLVQPYESTRRFAWTDGAPPEGREDHPVVLVSHEDAQAYAAWLSQQTGQTWRLPGAQEWEKAARGERGATFPWGDEWDPALLNSADQGPHDTMPVGSSRPAPAPSACSMRRARSSNGPSRPTVAAATSSRAGPGTTRAAVSVALPPATPGRTASSTS
jgi:formylglycine-generating enzyme required for sulfatase activity